jgi:hypothetical protein
MEIMPRTRIEELKDEYCDYHKDVYGVKARWVYGQDLTEDELLKMLRGLAAEFENVRRAEEAREEEAAVEATNKIQSLLNAGAKDVAQAIKWLHEAHDTGGDNMFLDYELGTKYGWVSSVLINGL